MAVHVTDAAADVIRRSLQQAEALPEDVGVRLRVAGGQVRPRFAPAPEPTDEVVELEGVRVFVDRQIADSAPEVTIDVSDEHETLVVRA
ncbi:MAG TPA: iron-sulfur cluster biosynthesis family protein [Actinomycetota bacterium]|jgi:Fe-S cluster assembly iron-binding protein IscA|nr:iron-sulfur cluster biosynthesis family protein [Actinomycetota bacterium]